MAPGAVSRWRVEEKERICEDLWTHMRMFKGRLEAEKRLAKDATELRELRSISITSILASGFSRSRLSFTSAPPSGVLAGMMTLAPRRARTLAVSFPMPLVPPAQTRKDVGYFITEISIGQSSEEEGGTCHDSREVAGVDALRDLLRRGRTPEARPPRRP